MTKEQLYGRVSAILMTLAELDGPAPASSIYLALGMDIDMYRRLVDLMKLSGLIIATPETLSLTDRGRSVAAELTRVVDKVKAQAAPPALASAMA